MSAYRELTTLQRRFVDRLVQRMNGTEAMTELRPRIKRPDVLASKWRALPLVQQAIVEREAQAMEDAGITNAQVLLDIARIGNVSIKEFHHPDGRLKALNELSDAAACVVEAVEFKDGVLHKYRLPSRLEAKKLLGAHLKLFTERHELTGADGAAIGMEISMNELGRRIAFAMVHGLATPGSDDNSQGSADRAQTQAPGSPPQAPSTDTDEE